MKRGRSMEDLVRATLKNNVFVGGAYSTTVARQLIDGFFAEVVGAVANGGDTVLIPGFGTFRWATTKPRRIRNPITMEWMELGQTSRLAFRAAKKLREGRSMIRCSCGDPATKKCHDCGRAICEWHSALGPRWNDLLRTIGLKAICQPTCNAPWWALKPKPAETRPREVEA